MKYAGAALVVGVVLGIMLVNFLTSGDLYVQNDVYNDGSGGGYIGMLHDSETGKVYPVDRERDINGIIKKGGDLMMACCGQGGHVHLIALVPTPTPTTTPSATPSMTPTEEPTETATPTPTATETPIANDRDD